MHEDLLPFNVIIDNQKAVFIDWEYGGILPYPMMLARLIAHTKDDPNYFFFMEEKTYNFAIDYYYKGLTEFYNISRSEYDEVIDAFSFYELIEWIYVYNKYGKAKDERYAYYFDKASNLAKKLLKQD